MSEKSTTILFILPVAFVQKPDEPGFQVQTQNFRTTFEFLLPRLNQRDIHVVLVSLNNSDRQLVDGKDYLQESGLDKKCEAFFLRRRMGRGRFFPQFVQFFLNLWYLSGVLKQTKPSLVYGYNDVGTLYGVFLKWLFRFRLVYDMRGDRVNEMAVQGALAWRVYFYRLIRDACLRSCDLVFTVSRNSSLIPGNKMHKAKFNYFDARVFYYDADIVNDVREELELAERFVFVYSGTDKHYQMIPAMVRFFARFLRGYPDAWFMINTPVDSEVFHEALQRNNVPASSYGVFHFDQRTLNRYQMAADIGFLIREDLPLNHEAFPTKFSEYLGSGVPVLITPHVHTLVDIVKASDLGVVWEPGGSEEALNQRLLKYRNNRIAKERCAAFAREHLSWQNNASWLADTLHGLC